MSAAPLGAPRFAEAFRALAAEDGPVVAAISGGPDSMALMGALARWAADRGGPAILCVTIDHGLRPGSREEAEAVGVAAAALGLSHRILAWGDRPPGRTGHAAARAARYARLAAAAREIGARRLVTAHTRDDQAETVMMRLAAGSGPAGLAAMRPVTRRGDLAHHRPLLGFAKAELVATCLAEGWPFHHDLSNADPRFARARWRRLLPALAAEGLDAARLARFAARQARAEDALAAQARAAAARIVRRKEGATVLDGAALLREPEEIGIRVLGAALGSETAPRLERLEGAFRRLADARTAGAPLRLTIAGRLVTLDRTGAVTLRPEGPRRRGKAVTLPVAPSPHSLGIPGPRT